MQVHELITYLQSQPQHLTVIYGLFSEHCMLAPDDIRIAEFLPPRPDGWVQSARPGEPLQKYLVLPGN